MTTDVLRLHALRFARAARHAGLPPALAGVLLLVGATLGFALLYARLGTWMPAAVSLTALYLVAYLSHPRRARWRETALGPVAMRRWRYGEAGAVLVLATAALLYLRAPYYLLGFLPAGVMLTWRPGSTAVGRVPAVGPALRRYAPFGKTPYALVAGLRRTWWVYAALGFVLAQAVLVGNGRLAVAVVLSWGLVPLGYHNEVEPEGLLRMHVRSAGGFLRHRCGTMLRQWAAWCAPATVLALACFPALWVWVLGGLLYAAAALVASVGAAYRAYPQRQGVLDGLTFAAALLLAPLLPLYAWWSLRGARRRLSRYLP